MQPTRLTSKHLLAALAVATLTLHCASRSKSASPETLPEPVAITATAPAAAPLGPEPPPKAPAKTPAWRGSPAPKPYSEYAGRRGFMIRPPLLEPKSDEAEFRRCDPVEIVRVEEKQGQIRVVIRQNGRPFVLAGANRRPFSATAGKIELLERYLKTSLDDLLGLREPAARASRLCNGEVWKEMTPEQFAFLAGDPEYRRSLAAAQGNFDVWTFVSGAREKPRFYYFLANRLYSWTK